MALKLEGIHHITCITADARRNVDFYARILGLRMVKKTVNQDQPSVYHLFYADEKGSPGSDLTFFEFPDAAPGRAGDGMVHRITWRVASGDALDFWAERLAGEGYEPERDGDRLRFRDFEGLELELAVVDTGDEPLIAEHPEIPADVALQGFDGVRAYSSQPERSRSLLEETLAFEPRDDGWEAQGERRGSLYAYDEPPAERGIQAAGTVHHVAWASHDEDHERWRERLVAAGAHPTPIIDRFWFRSIYFREPSGVLFELATFSPGFAADEDPERLGESLVLPPWLEDARDDIELQLTPIENPRQSKV
ncbi:MAG: VOC family protein [Chloroflexota bacterium]|nr:VOC family protein [Chloroflexota bacterium]